MQNVKSKTIDGYIKLFPKDIADRLKTVRKIVNKNAPEAIEVISYRMPAFKLNGILIYFAAYKDHLGIYPVTKSMGLTSAEIKKYKTGKGTLNFPNDEKLPTAFIERVIKNKTKENRARKKK